MRLTLGIDPGLGETGLVLLDEYGQVQEAATVRGEGPTKIALQRVENLAQSVRGEIWSWRKLRSNELLIAIEHPILRSTNVDTYRLQAATMHAIEREMLIMSMGFQGWGLVEVNPTTSKMQVTGLPKATKAQMVGASPFSYGAGNRRSLVEALADAWAHATVGQKGLAASTYMRFDEYREVALPAHHWEANCERD
jgi:Holliday junction resolvasome RuvABC endonuclease subunit